MRYSTVPGLLLGLLLLLCSGCEKEEEVSCVADCMDEYLAQNEMVRYQGEEFGCNYFMTLYQYENKQYFVLNNNCQDMISYPTDCEGNKLCEGGENTACRRFYEKAKFIGIVGIKK